jgi:hypothetical protein
MRKTYWTASNDCLLDQNRFDITKKVEEVKKGELYRIQKSELNKLKVEFKALDLLYYKCI